MTSSVFRFQQFDIEQGRSAMKLSTDGVLLGAWADVGCGSCRVLDVGTGTGIVSLMAAQRNADAWIDAVEIDTESAADALANFEASPWSDRLHLFEESFADFCDRASCHYDRILSNPPFFGEGVLSPNAARRRARHEVALPPDELFEGVSRLMTPEGCCSLIVPADRTERYVAAAARRGLFSRRRCSVVGVEGASPVRMLLTFARDVSECEVSNLAVLAADRRSRTPEYETLTKDFYLKK